MEPVPKVVTLDQCTIAPPAPPPGVPAVFTYDDVAQFKRVGKAAVYQWVRKGCIPSPVYTSGTARFTEDQVAAIMIGVGAPGTYPVGDSPRRATAQQAMRKKKAAAKKAAAKKAGAKKAGAKKGGAK